MLAVYESLVESAQNSSRKNLEGQLSLFQTEAQVMSGAEMGKKLPEIAEFPQNIGLAMEKEILGVYLTGHPLDAYKEKMSRISSITGEDLAHIEEAMKSEEAQMGAASGAEEQPIYDGMSCVLSGMVAGKKTLITKSNKMMAFIDLEDLYGVTEVVIFPNTYERCAELLQEDRVVAIKGTLNFKEDEAPKVLADEVLDIDRALEEGFTRRTRSGNGNGGFGSSFGSGSGGSSGSNFGSGSGKVRGASGDRPAEAVKPPQEHPAASPGKKPAGMIKLRIPADMDEAMSLEEIKTNLRRHRGDFEVLIYLPGGKTFRTEESLWAEPSEALRKQMAAILRAENVKM